MDTYFHVKIQKTIVTGIEDERPRYQLTIKVLGLSFLTLNSLVPHFLFIPSQIIAYCIIFIYFFYIQQSLFGLIKWLLYAIGEKGLKLLSTGGT